jgi:hypothetical protein
MVTQDPAEDRVTKRSVLVKYFVYDILDQYQLPNKQSDAYPCIDLAGYLPATVVTWF